MEKQIILTDPTGREMALLELIRRSTGNNLRPLLLTGGTVITMNSVMGDWQTADVLIVGSVIVGVGPGLLTAAADDRSIVIDCTGMMVMPAVSDYLSPKDSESLTPGHAAAIAVVRMNDTDTSTIASAGRPGHLDILLREGEVLVWDGQPVAGQTDGEATAATSFKTNPDSTRIGMWTDENDFVRQELLPDGRYDEARGDRPSAYQGQYWINGNRIDYLDDLGFWAYGEFSGDKLLHAGYRFTKK